MNKEEKIINPIVADITSRRKEIKESHERVANITASFEESQEKIVNAIKDINSLLDTEHSLILQSKSIIKEAGMTVGVLTVLCVTLAFIVIIQAYASQ